MKNDEQQLCHQLFNKPRPLASFETKPIDSALSTHTFAGEQIDFDGWIASTVVDVTTDDFQDFITHGANLKLTFPRRRRVNDQ